jgi:hypothetical protein
VTLSLFEVSEITHQQVGACLGDGHALFCTACNQKSPAAAFLF